MLEGGKVTVAWIVVRTENRRNREVGSDVLKFQAFVTVVEFLPSLTDWWYPEIAGKYTQFFFDIAKLRKKKFNKRYFQLEKDSSMSSFPEKFLKCSDWIELFVDKLYIQKLKFK